MQVCLSVYRKIWLYFNPLWGFLKSSVETYFLQRDFFCLLSCHVHLEDFVEACLALFLGCYSLLCVFTVLNAVCIYVGLGFLSLYVFGFNF